MFFSKERRKVECQYLLQCGLVIVPRAKIGGSSKCPRQVLNCCGRHQMVAAVGRRQNCRHLPPMSPQRHRVAKVSPERGRAASNRQRHRSSSPRAAVVSAPAHVTSAVIAGGGQAARGFLQPPTLLSKARQGGGCEEPGGRGEQGMGEEKLRRHRRGEM